MKVCLLFVPHIPVPAQQVHFDKHRIPFCNASIVSFVKVLHGLFSHLARINCQLPLEQGWVKGKGVTSQEPLVYTQGVYRLQHAVESENGSLMFIRHSCLFFCGLSKHNCIFLKSLCPHHVYLKC